MAKATVPRRRFGRTGLDMPVFSLGGMRHQHSWKDAERTPKKSQANVEAVLHRAFGMGINHFETARGYGTSEYEMGKFLKDFPRDEIILMTKGPPTKDPAEFERNLERSFKLLKIDYLELFGMHGINTPELLHWTVRPRGCMRVIRRWQDQGLIGHVGFSTHGPVEVICEAIDTDEFDYVNLHFYYMMQRNWEAVLRATKHDMGVFIISPQDKGGMLWRAPKRLREATRPLSPLLFNQLWTLSHPEVHTLSFGASNTRDLASCKNLIKAWPPKRSQLDRIDRKIQKAIHQRTKETWCSFCHECLPCPEGINIPEVLRLRNLHDGLDMKAFAKYRYNMFPNAGHWFPGQPATKCTECGDCLPRCPEDLEIPTLLFDLHRKVAGEARKRLGSH